MEQKGCESVIHDHDRDRLRPMLRCNDLPQSEVGVPSIRLVTLKSSENAFQRKDTH